MQIAKTIPVLSNMNELADFITAFWIGMIQNGRFEMPFEGNSKMSNLANMIRFTQTAEDKKIFSSDQIELIQKRTRKIIEQKLLKGGNLAVYTAYSNPSGYLLEMFKGVDIPHGRFPFELFTRYFTSLFDYQNTIEEQPERYKGKEGIEAIVKEYRGFDAVFCTRESGGGWTIIAGLKIPHGID